MIVPKVRVRISRNGASATYYAPEQSGIALKALEALVPPQGKQARAPRHVLMSICDGPRGVHAVRWESATLSSRHGCSQLDKG